jgi:hypothetical protein
MTKPPRCPLCEENAMHIFCVVPEQEPDLPDEPEPIELTGREQDALGTGETADFLFNRK